MLIYLLLLSAYWISFGNHGPRAEPEKGEGWKVAAKVTQLLALSLVVFGITRLFAKPPPRTMTKEWQEASNEYARVSTSPSSSSTSVFLLFKPPSVLLQIVIANTSKTERENQPYHGYQQ